jgi:hypothetical protein
MKTKLLLLVVLVVLTLSVNAQTKDEKPFKIGVGAMIGLPVSDYKDIARMAWGIDLMCEYAVVPEFGLTLSAGYLDWAKKSGFSGIKLGHIPVLVGAKYYFSDQLYGSGQVGLSFSTQSGGGSAFTFAPGIGYKISENFDLLLKYQSATKDGTNMSFIGLRSGLSF